MRKLSDITHIGRIVDWRLPSNRVLLLVPVGAALVLYGLDTSDLRRAFAGALGSAAAWMLARELDPDRPSAATIAAVLAPVSTLVLGSPAPAALFVTMLAARILARTTGLPPRTTDYLAVGAGAVLFAATPWGWAAGILLAFAMVRDAALPGDPPPNAGLWGAALAIGVTLRAALGDQLGSWTVPDATSLGFIVLGLAGAAVVTQPVPVLSVGDWTKMPLEPRRVREAGFFAVLTAALAVVAGGQAGVVAVAPLLVTFPAVAAARIASR
ncbi:MAG: hypothetical protein R3246_05550 [Acidimicrobiia bacterium]|nr:hypothetical protein [Acidimicrobiia bacterium]